MRQCCTDHNGNRKQKYKSQEDAEIAAEHRKREGVTVTIYPCEEGDGWHLTSQNAPPLERPIKTMTKEERTLYTKRNRNRMGSLFNEELIAKMRSEARNNSLSIFERNIELFQQAFNEKYRNYGLVRKQYVLAEKHGEDLEELRQNLLNAEQDLKVARQKLRTAKREYESAKRRIT